MDVAKAVGVTAKFSAAASQSMKGHISTGQDHSADRDSDYRRYRIRGDCIFCYYGS